MQLPQGFVAILDVLGARRRDPVELYNKLKSHHESAEKQANESLPELDPKLYDAFSMSVFGDTMLYTWEDMGFKEDQLLWFLHYIGCRIREGLYDDLPLRGALAYGEYYHPEENIVLGPAINDAAHWYNRTNWIGVHITECTYQNLKSCWLKPKDDDNDDLALKYYVGISFIAPLFDLPVKDNGGSSPKRSRVVNWIHWRLPDEEENSDPIKEMKQIERDNVGRLEELMGTAPEKAKVKYKNTICFAKQIMKKVIKYSNGRIGIDQF